MSSRTCPRLRRRRLHRLTAVAATATLSVAALAGCGTGTGSGTGSGDESRAGAGSSPASSGSASPSAGVASEGTDASASPSATPSDMGSATPSDAVSAPAAPTGGSDARRTTLPGRLLAAAELPGPTAGFRWTEGRTQRREPAALAGTCHRYSMLSIGAMSVAYRTYSPAAGAADGAAARADQLVARFADAKTAWRAYEVLKSWARDCDQALASHDRHDVGALQAVRADARAAHRQLLTYGPAGSPDEDWFDAQGMALVGSRVTVLRIRTTGQDYDYPAGKEPMVAAVRAAAAKLR